MSDVFSKPKRSDVMSHIRGRGNKETELALAKLLHIAGIHGWRRYVRIRLDDVHKPSMSVIPDFVFRSSRVAVFVDGCFWHGCPEHSNPVKWIAKSSMPLYRGSGRIRSGKTFWRQKLEANKQRDRAVNSLLRRHDWRVVRIWEHDLTKDGHRCVAKIKNTLSKQTK